MQFIEDMGLLAELSYVNFRDESPRSYPQCGHLQLDHQAYQKLHGCHEGGGSDARGAFTS